MKDNDSLTNPRASVNPEACHPSQNAGKAGSGALLVGQSFGFYEVIAPAARRGKHRIWTCRCVCGAVRDVYETNLRRRHDSCGCQGIERIRAVNTTHGEGGKGSASAEFRTWMEIRRRCFDPHRKSYPDYGGRGITMCDEWRNDFPSFLAAVGRKPTQQHSIERIDHNGNYEPGNVRWATRKEQNRNTRANHFVEFNGERKTLAEWGEVTGIQPATIGFRLRSGWPVPRALTELAVRGKNGAGAR